jgi:hypothetical protein
MHADDRDRLSRKNTTPCNSPTLGNLEVKSEK